jgi:hypothetical protein
VVGGVHRVIAQLVAPGAEMTARVEEVTAENGRLAAGVEATQPSALNRMSSLTTKL